MRSNTKILLLILFLLVLCLPSNGVYAFGAGNIPSFAYMEGKAFRHGDIEDTLAELAKKYGGSLGALGSLVGMKGTKFGGLDIKRVYFGNWLRDYSQAVDITGLKKMPLQTIINLCMALGFLAHGYATNEFEVTVERLGVYLPTEHIDNPKGYGEGQDARKFDPRLRGPVDPRELDIDPRTGMKNYIANENGTWDTSKALARRVIEKCIYHGRMQRANGQKHDEYEAYRLLGTALHTLEDFPAHSNFCELSLVSMGYTQVFMHVGNNARVKAPDGKWVAPLVTGTFGSSDFIHSLLGEASDHISQASVSDLNTELANANAKASGTRDGRGGTNNSFSYLQELVSAIPLGGGSDMKNDLAEMQKIRTENVSGAGKPADQLNPQELHAKLWAILSLRDRIVKKIEHTIENIPGLGPLIEKLMDAISVLVFTALEPLLKPLMRVATTDLQAASGEVIDKRDQYEVFDLPNATDPTHSFLSKDHFNLLLNEPAGHLAKIIVTHAVELIVKAWDDPNMNTRNVTEDILQCLFHPDFHNVNSKIQREMMKYMYSWINGLGSQQRSVLDRLTMHAVRNHNNVRLTSQGGALAAGSFGQNTGYQAHGVISAHPGSSHTHVYQDAYTTSTSVGHQHQHHGGHGSHGGGHQGSFASAGYGGGEGPGLLSLPNIPGLNLSGLSAVGKMSGLMRDIPGEPSSESSFSGGGGPHQVSHHSESHHVHETSSSYAPAYDRPAFPSMPHEPSGHSSYAPSYAPPIPSVPAPFGFSPGPAPGFPDPGREYRGVNEGDYLPGGSDGQWGGPPGFEGEAQYGFTPTFPTASHPHSRPHSRGSHGHHEHKHEHHKHHEHRHEGW